MNYSSKQHLSFQARGDGQTYTVAIFLGRDSSVIPAMYGFDRQGRTGRKSRVPLDGPVRSRPAARARPSAVGTTAPRAISASRSTTCASSDDGVRITAARTPCALNELIQNIREPPPESLVGYMTHFEGRFMRNMPFVILINLAWIYLWPLLAREPFLTVILPTLIATVIFVYLHLCTYFYGGPPEVRIRYILGEYLLGFVLAPFNPSSLGFLIFAFFVTSFSLPMRVARYVIFGSVVLFAARDRAARPQQADAHQCHPAGRPARDLRALHLVHHPAEDGSCGAATRKSCGSPRSPSANASAATCTTC